MNHLHKTNLKNKGADTSCCCHQSITPDSHSSLGGIDQFQSVTDKYDILHIDQSHVMSVSRERETKGTPSGRVDGYPSPLDERT